MLEIVRRSKGVGRIILGLVVVGVGGSFIAAIFAVWGGGISGTAQSADWILKVDGESIPAAEFQQRRGAVETSLREQLGGQEIDEQTLAGFVDQQALASILSFRLAEREAERAGLRVLPSEISETIRAMPVFQRDGRFVGIESYRSFIRTRGLDVAGFEGQVAGELAADKIRLALFGIARADDREVARRYREEVERADVDYVLLADSDFATGVKADDKELRRWFDENQDRYMTRETRNASFVLFDREALAASMEIPEDEVREAYEAGKESRYTHGEQRRASHILLQVDPSGEPGAEAAQEAAANDILAQIRSGGSFEELARARSEDQSSAARNGDLGWFERGRMVREFEDVAFALPVGSVSDVLRTSFGFHIIKTTDSRPAGTSTLEDVREDLRRELAVQRAQQQIRERADAFTTKLAAEASSFQSTASEMGLTVEQTGAFSRSAPAGRLGRLPLVEDAVFSLSSGSNSAAVSVPQGLVVFHLDSVEGPKPKPFEEVRPQVSADWKLGRARELGRASSDRILAAPGTLRERAKARKLDVTSYAAVTRVQPMPPLTDASKEAALLAQIGSVIGPFETSDGLLLLEVTRKSPSSEAEAEAERASLREEVLLEERQTIFQSVMSRAQMNSEIDINQALLRTGAATR
jgi:peptidyl-prolyl cis-trans isomerase D